MLLDTHCHLDLFPAQFDLIQKYQNQKIRLITMTNAPCVWEQNLDLFKNAKQIRVALGLHPQLVHQRENEINLFEKLLPRARYIGEVGLDGTKRFKEYLPLQSKIFKKILNLCSQCSPKIISVHSAGAYKQVEEALSQSDIFQNGEVILHWYTGSLKSAKRCIELGCFFSINPKMTLSKKGKQLIESLPPDRILPESDSPFIRIGDRPSEPWDVQIVYDYLSKIWGLSTEETRRTINNNLKKITTTD